MAQNSHSYENIDTLHEKFDTWNEENDIRNENFDTIMRF